MPDRHAESLAGWGFRAGTVAGVSDLGSSPRPARPAFDPRGAPSARALLGGPAVGCTSLTHNPLNAVTGGIWRVEGGSRSVVAKLLTDGRDHDGPPGWATSTDPAHWNWWEREWRVYTDGIVDRFRPDGLVAPELLVVDRIGDGSVLLWFEDVDGAMPTTVEGLADLAHRLGRAQGRLAGRPIEPWLTHGFQAAYAGSKPVDGRVFDHDPSWAHPLVAKWLAPLRDDLRRLHQERARFFALVARCPQTLCHLDLWPANILQREDGGFALLDWAFCGEGALGEDIANLVPDSVFDLLLPTDLLPALAETLVERYLAGLHDAGWEGDDRLVRLAVHASAAKYHWLAERMVLGTVDGSPVVYGGRPADADELYRARGEGLALLCRWADEARTTARALGWW